MFKKITFNNFIQTIVLIVYIIFSLYINSGINSINNKTDVFVAKTELEIKNLKKDYNNLLIQQKIIEKELVNLNLDFHLWKVRR